MMFGLGWRAPLGAGILANLDRIDVVELMAEDFFDAGRATRRAIRFLSTQVPVVVHATSLGLAASERVHQKSLDAVARVIEWVEPLFWSEHLSFVRAAGFEIGHLAAPPRNQTTLASLQKNVSIARTVVGTAPLLENVATLVDPPLSDLDEATWLMLVAEACDTRLLLDLHNLHANATNFGFDAVETVRRIEPARIGAIHLAGGRRIERDRVLDDHLHAVPDPVYELFAEVATNEAVVILERDGNYPPVDDLLAELDRARAVVRSASAVVPPHPSPAADRRLPAIDAFLARIYVDDRARSRFLSNPHAESRAMGFDEATAHELATIDADDLALAVRSFSRKREARARH